MSAADIQAESKPERGASAPVRSRPEPAKKTPQAARRKGSPHAPADVLALARSSNRAVAKLVAQGRASAQEEERKGPTPVPEEVASRVRSAGTGRPLSPQISQEIKPVLGRDPSDVRVHTTQEADALARTLRARAFTSGREVFFRTGAYDPHSSAGRELLAHEATHAAIGHESRSAPAAVLRQADGPRAPAAAPAAPSATPAAPAPTPGTPAPPPAAAGLAARWDPAPLLAKYPHLARSIGDEGTTQVKRALDARKRIEELADKRRPYEGSALSEDVRRVEAINAEMRPFQETWNRDKAFGVPTDKLLAGDVLPQPKDSPDEAAYKESLYAQLLVNAVRVEIREDQGPDLQLHLTWGPGNWWMANEGGLIRFVDLMKIEKLNLGYQAALLKRSIKLTERQLKIAESGGTPLLATDKKLGEIYGYVYNSNVKVGPELGNIGGYPDDGRGQAQAYSAMLRAKGAKAVLKAPDGFLHVFALDPADLSRQSLDKSKSDGNVYLLDKGRAKEVDPWLIVTADHFVLQRAASSPMGAAWYCTADPLALGSIEQFAIGAIFGDAWEDPTVESAFGQIVIGLIPIVGQVADARDVAIGIYKIWQTGASDGKLQTALALIGFVPGLGDAIKTAKSLKTGAKAAVKEAIQQGTPAAQKAISREILDHPGEVRKLFPGISEAGIQTLKELPEMSAKALKEGGEAATTFAKSVTDLMASGGGNAGTVVALAGGKWADIAKALARDPTGAGEAVGKQMQTWRKAQFEQMQQTLVRQADEVAPIKAAEGGTIGAKPESKITGTDSYLSDVDISFLGPSSVAHRNAAIRHMTDRFGEGWAKLLDSDIFSDPTRLHLFEGLGGKAAKEAEAVMVKESELNILARMMRGGVPMERVQEIARKLGVNMEDVTARQARLADLAGNPEAYARLELKQDDLHRRFLAESDPAAKAALARELAENQSLLNAAIPKGPYATPGGVGRHVTRREDIMGIRAGPHVPLSPAMGYMSFLDDLYALEKSLVDLRKAEQLTGEARAELWSKSVKDMGKYADRLMVSAGQHGVDFANGSRARELFMQMEGILSAARRDPGKLAEAEGLVQQAAKAMDEQLVTLTGGVKKNADEYLAAHSELPAAVVLKDMDEARKTLITSATLAREASIILRNIIRAQRHEAEAEAATQAPPPTPSPAPTPTPTVPPPTPTLPPGGVP
jgi:Domain of unknown function (DUF4157)